MADQIILNKIKKLFALAEGSQNESLSDSDAAEKANEALVAMMTARKYLAKYHIDESEIRAKSEAEHIVYVAPTYGISFVTNPYKRANARGLKQRRIWFEKLAEVIAEGNYCKIGIQPTKGSISFYGFEMDREVCIFTFESLARIAANLCKLEMKKAKAGAGAFNFKTKEQVPAFQGEDCFIESFHQGFREIIKEMLFSEDGNGKQSEGVEAFWLDNCSYSERAEYVWNNWQFREDNEIEINDYYAGIGKKIAEQAASKLKLEEGTENLVGLVQTTVIKRQEKQIKAQIERYKALGIDESLPPEVIIACDTSGSMYGANKLSQMKEGAISYAKDVSKKGYKVGMTTFGNYPEKFVTPSSSVNGEFTAIIDSLSANGGTPMDIAINAANEYFKGTKARRFLMIITDGQPNSREMALEEARKAKENGVIIQCIGTTDAPQEFLDQLSSSGKGLLVGNAALGEGIKRMAGLLGA